MNQNHCQQKATTTAQLEGHWYAWHEHNQWWQRCSQRDKLLSYIIIGTPSCDMTCKCVDCNHEIWATDPTKPHQFHDKFCGWRGKLISIHCRTQQGYHHGSEECKRAWPSCRRAVHKAQRTALQNLQSEGQDPPALGEHNSYQVLLTVREGPQVERVSAKLTKTENGFSSVRSMSSHQVQDSNKGSGSSGAALPVHSHLDGLIKYSKGDSAKMLTLMDDRTTTEWVEPQADECGKRSQSRQVERLAPPSVCTEI